MSQTQRARIDDSSFTAALAPILALAMAEDIGDGDITGNATVKTGTIATARIIAKETVTVCGLEVWAQLMDHLAPGKYSFQGGLADGARAHRDEEIARVQGPARALLAGERIAMNLICHLTGIATLTSRFVEIAGGLTILDTRKTTPGFRILDKYAVRVGGGHNHRMSLNSGVLIKENHVVSAGSVAEAVRRARELAPTGVRVECEVRNRKELQDAVRAGAEAVLLDNMGDAQIEECLELLKAEGTDIFVEASGNMTLERVTALAPLAEKGLTAVSIGALTHSRPYADLSMLMNLNQD